MQTAPRNDFSTSYFPGERQLYTTLRERVPIIDAAIMKIRHLVGGFEISCPEGQYALNEFLKMVPVGAGSHGIDSFIGSYLEQLLTFGNAAGEMILTGDNIGALYNVPLQDIVFKGDSLIEPTICRAYDEKPVLFPQLVLHSALNPLPGSMNGVSILRGLPFVSDILLKIYKTIGINWERLGNVRFAVTYKPGNGVGEQAYSQEKAQQIAKEWSRAMHSDGISDFVAVGDVNIRAIGADNQILDSDIPVRQMLEQIVAKMGIPPFLLGLSWSSTERMSSQQADILMSELASYRRQLEPVILKICKMWLLLNGYKTNGVNVKWQSITLQDEVDHANARLMNAKAALLEYQLKQEKREGRINE